MNMLNGQQTLALRLESIFLKEDEVRSQALVTKDASAGDATASRQSYSQERRNA